MKGNYQLLVCDDNEFVRETCRVFIEDLPNVSVDLAEDGKEAVDKLSEKHYDLIIVDLMMPYFSGNELIHMIRYRRASNVPIIVLSGHLAQDNMKDQLSQLGVNLILTKPYLPDTLNAAICQQLQIDVCPEYHS